MTLATLPSQPGIGTLHPKLPIFGNKLQVQCCPSCHPQGRQHPNDRSCPFKPPHCPRQSFKGQPRSPASLLLQNLPQRETTVRTGLTSLLLHQYLPSNLSYHFHPLRPLQPPSQESLLSIITLPISSPLALTASSATVHCPGDMHLWRHPGPRDECFHP